MKLCISDLTLEQYLSFFPKGSHYQALQVFISSMVRNQIVVDLQLQLGQDETNGLQLGSEHFSLLGKTTFLANTQQLTTVPSVTITMQ